jgi:uncharacterized membrane protein YgcG
MRRVVLGGLLLAPLLLLVPTRTIAQGDDLALKRNDAIEKGIAWLKARQASDGSWMYDDGPFHLTVPMRQGCTALCALALMKSGVAPDDAVINKAFDFINSVQIEHVYEAGCVLLALEARYNWEPPAADDDAGDSTREKKGPAVKKLKAQGRDVDLAQRCVAFLAKTQQETGSWSYPNTDSFARMGTRTDLSNTQYALLGLDAAERLNVPVPKALYEKSQEFFVTNQEKDGAEVAGFPVPGADMSYRDLKKVEKEMRDKLKQIETSFKGKAADDVNAEGHTQAEERRTTEEDAARKILRTVSALPKMHARGWTYTYAAPEQQPGGGNGGTQGGDPNGGNGGNGGGRRGGRGGGRGRNRGTTGSMTTAGLACLFICKAHLDGTQLYEKSLKGPIDKALRDGAAWVAENFSVAANPGAEGGNQGRVRAGHLYYYLYGLERAGVLLLVPKFGTHDWYDEGSRAIVGAQTKEGSWDAGDNGTVGPVCDTCFALLYLARGTTPIVRIPTRTATGPGAVSK